MNRDYPSVPAGSQLADAARLMAWSRLPMVPVCDPSGALVGVITERMVVAAVALDAASPDRVIDDLMDPDPAVIADYATVEWVLVEMQSARRWSLPVVDHEDRMIGVVSLTNLADHVSPAILHDTWRKIVERRQD